MTQAEEREKRMNANLHNKLIFATMEMPIM